ncbi:DNA primase [Thermovibrio sp.]
MGSSKVSHSFIEELLSQVDIVEVVSHYLPLKQVGRNFTALCPFHPEKTPSFVVSPEKQIFKCFGCGVGGNAITFVEKYEGVSFFEAIKRVAEICGIELPQQEFKKEEGEEVGEFGFRAAKYFHSKVDAVLPYLKERGVEQSSVEKFLLGYAPRGYLSELRDIPDEVLRELGLKSQQGKEFFRERLIIPIFNHSGKVVAFAGRALKEDSSPKYINSPESRFFKKGSLLYGFYQSKDEIIKKRQVVIVEGYFDVISLHGAGFCNCVAPMGTSLTESHCRFIKRYSSSPVLLFDGDGAGRKATLRSAELFFKLGVEPLVVQLPQGEDPDSLARKSRELLKRLLENPLPFIRWAVEAGKSLPVKEKEEFLRGVARSVAPLKSVKPITYKEFVALLSAEFGIDERWIKLQSPRLSLAKEELSQEPVPYYEKVFLKSLLEGSLKLPFEISPTVFVSSKVAKLYTVITKAGVKEPTLLQAEYPEEASFISELLLMEVSEDDILKALCKLLTKELENRLKSTKALREKLEIKKVIFSLKRGEIGALDRLKIN